MNCKTCDTGDKVEIAVKITGRNAAGIMRCHRLECGHAWHVASCANNARSLVEFAEPARCTCREIVAVNTLIAEGRRHQALGEDLTEDAFMRWFEQVREALDGIPSESSAPSLARSAATVAKSKTSHAKKITDLNKLLERAIKAVS